MTRGRVDGLTGRTMDAKESARDPKRERGRRHLIEFGAYTGRSGSTTESVSPHAPSPALLMPVRIARHAGIADHRQISQQLLQRHRPLPLQPPISRSANDWIRTLGFTLARPATPVALATVLQPTTK